ncbi:AAA family ATPase [Chloroflexota bacterium]
MIPVKLTMRNFMCYRDNVPPLNFSSIHLACLSGDNGNGKSALIDAITWALWGQARAKSDDDLIYTGQQETEVEFDFTSGQQLYRIIRKRSRPRRSRSPGQTILELQISDGDGFRSVTGSSIAQTQQNISGILHMDYDTFVNSAYLRQGHADQFTNQTPAKRKEVLGNILDLALYDELEEKARELARQQEAEKTQLEHSISEIGDELARKPDYDTEMARAQNELSGVEESIKEKETGLNGQRQQKEALERKKAQQEQIEAKLRETMGNLERWDEQVKQHQSRLQEYEELISQRPAIEEGYARFAESKNLCDELNQKLAVLVRLNDRKSQLLLVINREQAAITGSHTETEHKIAELENKTRQLPSLKKQHQQVLLQINQFGEQDEIVYGKKQAGQELQTGINQLESTRTGLEREIRELGEKLDLLSTQNEAMCPLCETELAIEGLKLIESKYTVERHTKSDALNSNQAELTDKKSRFNSLQKEITQLESQISEQKTTAQGNIRVLENQIAEAESTEKQLAEQRERLTQIEQRLAGKDFATAEQQALAEMESELASLDYHSEQHEQARSSLSELEQYDNSKRRLDEADRLIQQEKESAARAEESAQKLRDSQETDSRKRQELSTELEVLPALLDGLAVAEAEYRALITQQNQAQEVMGSVKAKLQRLEEQEIKRKEKAQLLSQSARQEDIYKELVKAFGKGGIQALLIEIALPEIEIEANSLLARMTDNRMSVKFETQRETKRGSVIETLDINISDELGTRNYEMFSGGEAFRINFAIRISLSKLLAKRAGAPLSTLIIDEGFGTQDTTGIEKLREAINSIQDDFNKIFVITHIEELRDAFPTRIDIAKTAQGSTISVN